MEVPARHPAPLETTRLVKKFSEKKSRHHLAVIFVVQGLRMTEADGKPHKTNKWMESIVEGIALTIKIKPPISSPRCPHQKPNAKPFSP